MCLVFNLLGHPEAWLVMFYYAFIVVGFGAAMTGMEEEHTGKYRCCGKDCEYSPHYRDM